ncbi:hypothetical protein PG984_009154 [Apiospora sp. TS-2023a]
MPAELPTNIPADWPTTSDQQEITGTMGDDSSYQESQTPSAVLAATLPRPATRREHYDGSIDEIAATEGNLIDEKMDRTPAPLPHTPSEAVARWDSWFDDDGFEDRPFVNGWDVEALMSMPHVLYYPSRSLLRYYGTFMDDDAAVEGRRLRSQLRPAMPLGVTILAILALVGFIFIASLILYTFLG